ncbi:hypothetical protein GCM10009550_45130 [Actinocorallia libanotica]|uniref:Transposase n=1 Tax=Actinocorallia libanotica TaxID=46162 RepID=A0ABP4C154_9ACTN
MCTRYWWALWPPYSGVARGVDISAKAHAATVQLAPGAEPKASRTRFGRWASTAMAMPRTKNISDLGSSRSL